MSAIRWQPLPPHESAQPSKEFDPNHFLLADETDLGGRLMQAAATGDRTTATNLYLEDPRTQDSRGNVLESLHRKGCQVQLMRCGEVYTRSSRCVTRFPMATC
jgi:hypothetical protein